MELKMKMKMKNLDNCEKLIQWATYEGTEFGEYCMSLCNLDRYSLPSKFQVELNSEVLRCLNWFEENCEIIKREEIRTISVIELKYKNE